MTAEKSAEKDPRYIAMGVTPELLAAVRKAAGNMPLGTYVRNVVAKELGINVDSIAVKPRTKYATEAERKAALERQRIERKELVKMLLAEHRAKLAAQAKAEAEAAAK